jgi:hypothetical protein
MASATPVRRSARLAEKAATQVAPVVEVAPIPKPVSKPKKKVVEDTHFRDLTPEEMKADFELRTKMLTICEAIIQFAKRPRTNEDFKIVERAAEKLYEMSRGIVYDSMDGFFICDIISNSRKATIGSDEQRYTIDCCSFFISSLKNRMKNQPTRTFDPK